MFSWDTIERAWDRQGGVCAGCGKTLVWANRDYGTRGAWHAHHRKPVVYDGSDYLSNCVLLCVNPPNCHLYLGHGGDYANRVVLHDENLPYLYAGQ